MSAADRQAIRDRVSRVAAAIERGADGPALPEMADLVELVAGALCDLNRIADALEGRRAEDGPAA